MFGGAPDVVGKTIRIETGFLANYERMEQAPLVPHAEVVAFVRERKLNGRGIGWFRDTEI
jgi:hypothetical protein